MKQKFFIVFGAAFLITAGVCVGYLFLYWYRIAPLLETFGETQREIKITEEQNRFFADAVETDLKKYEDEFDAIKKLYFDKPYEAIFFFEKAAKRNHLTQTNVTAPTGEPPSMSLTVMGSYANIIRFLQEVENDTILVEINTLLLQGNGESVSANIKATFRKL
jgi:hypothetical protein